jgi:hypothetical protein
MPISLTFTEQTLSQQSAQDVGAAITALFLDLHGLTNNRVMGPGVTIHINFLPKAQSLSNGKSFNGAWVEARTPSFAFTDVQIQKQFFSKAADLIEAAAAGSIERVNIHGSAIYAVDGT